MKKYEIDSYLFCNIFYIHISLRNILVNQNIYICQVIYTIYIFIANFLRHLFHFKYILLLYISVVVEIKVNFTNRCLRSVKSK